MHSEFWSRIFFLLGNTLAVSGLTTLFAGVPGIALGVAVFRYRLRAGKLYRAIFAAAAFFPLHALVTGWYAVCSGVQFQLEPRLFAALLMFPAYLPLMFWITALALALHDRSHTDAALLEARPCQVLRFIILPECRPVLCGGLLLIFILASGEVTATDVLRVRTFAEEIFTQFQLRRIDQARGVAAILLGLIFALTLLLAAALRSIRQLSSEGFAQRIRQGERWRGPALLEIFVCAAIGVVYGLPLIALLREIGSWSQFRTACATIREELLLTGSLAPAGALAIGLAAPPLAWLVIGDARSAHEKLFSAAFLRLFAVLFFALLPAPVLGYAMIALFDRPGLPGMIYDSNAIVVLTHVARFLPLLILLAAPFVGRLPEELTQLSRLDGAGRLRFIRSILFPLSGPLMLILGLLAFALIVGETGATMLVAPPGATMLSVRIFTLLHYGVYFDVSAAALIVMLAMGSTGLIALLLIERLLPAV